MYNLENLKSYKMYINNFFGFIIMVLLFSYLHLILISIYVYVYTHTRLVMNKKYLKVIMSD